MAGIGARIRRLLDAPMFGGAAPTVDKARRIVGPFAAATAGAPYTSTEIRRRTPRKGSAMLREFARTDEYVRTAIARRRQQVAQADWTIERFSGEDADGRVQAYAYALFSYCNDKGDSFRNVLDKIVEDLLVLDAGCLELEKDLGGRIVSIIPIDAATIAIDPDWDGSDPGAIRYRQIVDGDIAGEWTTDEFVYIQANPSTHALYGWSPVETLVRTIEADLFTGNYEYEMLRQTAPEGILSLGDVPPDAVDAFREFYMMHLAGTRQVGIWGGSQHLEFIPFKPSAREAQRAEYRTYLARKIAAVFQIDPLLFGFAEGANRSISETMQSQTDEGYKALATVVSEAISRSIIRQLAFDHVFHFTNLTSRDEMAQAQIDRIRVTTGLDTINEIRDRDGKAPLDWGDDPPPTLQDAGIGVDGALGAQEDPAHEPDVGSRGGRVDRVAASVRVVQNRAVKILPARTQLALPPARTLVKARRRRKARNPNARREKALERELDTIMRAERTRIAGAWQPFAAQLERAAHAHVRRLLGGERKALGDSAFWESLRDLPGALVNFDAFRDAVRAGRSTFPGFEDNLGLEGELAAAWAARARTYADRVPGRIVDELTDAIDVEIDDIEEAGDDVTALDVMDAVNEKIESIGAGLGNYADAVYPAGEGSYGEELRSNEVLLRWNCVEDDRSCDGPGSCPELAKLGPQAEFPAWPGDGTLCFSNCRCTIQADEDSWNDALRSDDDVIVSD